MIVYFRQRQKVSQLYAQEMYVAFETLKIITVNI